jgi:hypothetical protein
LPLYWFGRILGMMLCCSIPKLHLRCLSG